MPGWISAEQDARLVFVIDNSASMSVKNGGEISFRSIKEYSNDPDSSIQSETNINIFQTCPPKLIYSGLQNSSQRNALKSIRPTASYDNLWNSILKGLADGAMVSLLKNVWF